MSGSFLTAIFYRPTFQLFHPLLQKTSHLSVAMLMVNKSAWCPRKQRFSLKSKCSFKNGVES